MKDTFYLHGEDYLFHAQIRLKMGANPFLPALQPQRISSTICAAALAAEWRFICLSC